MGFLAEPKTKSKTWPSAIRVIAQVGFKTTGPMGMKWSRSRTGSNFYHHPFSQPIGRWERHRPRRVPSSSRGNVQWSLVLL